MRGRREEGEIGRRGEGEVKRGRRGEERGGEGQRRRMDRYGLYASELENCSIIFYTFREIT